MGYKFNHGNGAFICDECNIIMLDYLPASYFEEFLRATKTSGKFKGIDIWSKNDYRFCSAICMKRYNNEDSTFTNVVYGDKL